MLFSADQMTMAPNTRAATAPARTFTWPVRVAALVGVEVAAPGAEVGPVPVYVGSDPDAAGPASAVLLVASAVCWASFSKAAATVTETV
ncbi:hypothetical protein CPLU01_00918 [Colletotrichum plurivorum]|uniref:Uncharacterized protein n=1 Tax=Colletotrichum plurivorum TaxID=2175906 RepID=A0A8H6NQW6_9PEZI|nr:hypothetical protein CPLU01_00918 [Colletotrichum plurivorum]